MFAQLLRRVASIGELLSKTPLAKIIVIEIPHYRAIGKSLSERRLAEIMFC
jgi:hypothetical protein